MSKVMIGISQLNQTYNFSNLSELMRNFDPVPYNDSIRELLQDPNVVILTWQKLNQFAGFVFVLGVLIGYGICYLRFRRN